MGQIQRMRQSTYEYLYVKAGANLEIKLLDFLKFNSRFGMDISRSLTDGFQPKYTLNANDYANENTVIQDNSRSNYFVWEQTLSYDQTFGKFKIGALVGTSAEETSVSSVNASIQGVINNDKDMAILNAGTTNPAVSGYPYDNSCYHFSDVLVWIMTASISLLPTYVVMVPLNLLTDINGERSRPYQLHGVFP